MSTLRSDSLSRTLMSGYSALKAGISGATSFLPSASGAEMKSVPFGWAVISAMPPSTSRMVSRILIAPL
jgi:hypothetical protein